jgi:hypothetical protein
MANEIADGQNLFNNAYAAANGDLRGLSAVGLAVASGLQTSGVTALASAAMSAASDASAGLAIGSAVPGIGSVVGAIIGAFIGFISGLFSSGPPTPAHETRQSTALKFVFPWKGGGAVDQDGSGIGWVRPPACPATAAGALGCGPTDNSAQAAYAIWSWGSNLTQATFSGTAPDSHAMAHQFVLVGNYLGGNDPAQTAIDTYVKWYDPDNALAVAGPPNGPGLYTDNAAMGLAEIAALGGSSAQALHYMLSMAWLWRRGLMTDGLPQTDVDDFSRVIGHLKAVVAQDAASANGGLVIPPGIRFVLIPPGGSSTKPMSTPAKVATGAAVAVGGVAAAAALVAWREHASFLSVLSRWWRSTGGRVTRRL